MACFINGKSMQLAIMLSLVIIALTGLSGASSLAGEIAPALTQIETSQDSACASSQHSQGIANLERNNTIATGEEITIAHGTWHPCANDANACGAGHSCCDGHCVYGSCTD